MNKKHWFTLSVWLAAGSLCVGATVPAGTVIAVRTNAPISTHATPGNHFTAALDQGVGGLSPGTRVTGLIVASRARATSRSNPLTLTLTSISVHSGEVKIKTNSVEPQGAHTTRRRASGVSVGEDTFPAGTSLQFRLKDAVNL